MSITVGNISSVSNNINHNICMVDSGVGPEVMVHVGEFNGLSQGHVLILSKKDKVLKSGQRPSILAATDGTHTEPVYITIYLPVGFSFNIETEFIPGTRIVRDLVTNDKCEVCWKGVPIATSFGTIKVSTLANAQICSL